MSKIPRGMFSTDHDGLADPERATPEQVIYVSSADITRAREAFLSPSWVVQALWRARQKALGRG